MSYTLQINTAWPIVIPNATTTSDGLMSAADKAKLDSLVPGGGTTLAQTYQNDANPADSTIIVDNVRGPVAVDASLIPGVGFVLVKENVGTTSNSPGLSLQNTDSPVPGSASYSPSLLFEGRSNVTGVEKVVNFYVQNRPVGNDGSGAGGARGLLTVDFEQGSGPYASGELLSLDSANPGVLTIGGVPVDVNGAALNDVLTFDGSKFAPAPGGGGGIGGTIAIDEVAVGSGPNTIYGDSRFLWNGATGVLSVNNAGSFFSVNTSTEVLTVASASSPAVTTIEPNITTISNGVGNVSLLAVGGSGAIGTTGAVPLDILLTDELRINGAPGAAGQVLTSQGAGLPPIWAPGGGGGGGVASVTASAPLASSGGANPDISITAGSAPGDVLAWNGAAWASTAPAGTIGGTIAANEVAFGTGANTIGGDARITWTAGAGIFSVNNGLGPFLDVNTVTSVLTVSDPVTPSVSTLTPNEISVTDNVAAQISLKVQSGTPTIDTTVIGVGALDLVVNELRINGAPGAIGEVLTSQGAGLPPVWSATPSLSIASELWVTTGGSDVTGDGSLSKPYATIGAAMAAITTATPASRWAIRVAAGAYTEGALSLKPNVFIIGDGLDAVRITAASYALDASFTGGADNRSGAMNAILTGASNYDWTTVTSTAGKLYFRSVVFASAFTMTGYNNAIPQAQFSSCQFFGALNVQGINVGVFDDNILFSTLTLTQSPFGGVPTILAATGGNLSGALTATTTVNDFNRRISVFARSFLMGSVTIDGPSTYLDVTVDSVPSAGVTILNGATRVDLNQGGLNRDLSNLQAPTAANQSILPDATNTRYLGDFGRQWLFNFNYVTASTDTDLYIVTTPATFGSTAVGHTIFMQPDAYGIDVNVNGGGIELETIATTGTGNSGRVLIKTGTVVGGTRGDLDVDVNEVNLDVDGALNVNAAPGASGDVLTSQGAGLPPVWSAPAAAPVLTIGEIPGGLVNGANTVFTTAANFTANTTMVYVNGLRQLRGVGNDYTETGPNQITFAVAPLAGFQLQIDYYPV